MSLLKITSCCSSQRTQRHSMRLMKTTSLLLWNLEGRFVIMNPALQIQMPKINGKTLTNVVAKITLLSACLLSLSIPLKVSATIFQLGPLTKWFDKFKEYFSLHNDSLKHKDHRNQHWFQLLPINLTLILCTQLLPTKDSFSKLLAISASTRQHHEDCRVLPEAKAKIR